LGQEVAMVRMGTWTTKCAQDARFNMDGRAEGSMFGVPAMDAAIQAKQKELGLTDQELDRLSIEVSFCKE
jgi:hypothetical protein